MRLMFCRARGGILGLSFCLFVCLSVCLSAFMRSSRGWRMSQRERVFKEFGGNQEAKAGTTAPSDPSLFPLLPLLSEKKQTKNEEKKRGKGGRVAGAGQKEALKLELVFLLLPESKAREEMKEEIIFMSICCVFVSLSLCMHSGKMHVCQLNVHWFFPRENGNAVVPSFFFHSFMRKAKQSKPHTKEKNRSSTQHFCSVYTSFFFFLPA
mmetsp:Transcript_30643/g.60287  ORF Transcript_30643/g.60287 Transcript_30643/m.60287 type:complete len:209 (-) Transcript_30643:532-1158(-)